MEMKYGSGRLQKTRVVVIYCSKGGNTRKVAEAIAGSGNYLSGPGKEMVEFLEGLEPAEDRYGAVFGTAGGSNRGHLEKMKKVLEGKGVRLLGEWTCPGQEFSLKNKGRPNEEDLAEARRFAEKTLKKIEVI
jgi:flavodoxin